MYLNCSGCSSKAAEKAFHSCKSSTSWRHHYSYSSFQTFSKPSACRFVLTIHLFVQFVSLETAHLADTPVCGLQETALASCTLKVQLEVGSPHTVLDQAMVAKDIVSLSSALGKKHSIAVQIDRCYPQRVRRTEGLPGLQALMPWTHHINCFQVQNQHPAPSSNDTHVYRFTVHFFSTISYDNSPLQAVCIETRELSTIRCATLTKLHISSFSKGNPDFTQFSCKNLQDLALQTPARLSCPNLLHDSKQALRFVSLAGRSCCAETYRALAQLPKLETSIIRVWTISATQANALRPLQADSAQMVLHYNLSNALSKLSTAALRLSKLTLWQVSDKQIAQLQQLPTLTNLTIANSLVFTGCALQAFPLVVSLTLVSCPGITAKSMRHMLLTAFPALEELSFGSGAEQLNRKRLCLHSEVIESLHFGQSLGLIDLRGVPCPTHQQLLCLQRHVQQQMTCREVYVSVLLQLPPVAEDAEAENLNALTIGLCERLSGSTACSDSQQLRLVRGQ